MSTPIPVFALVWCPSGRLSFFGNEFMAGGRAVGRALQTAVQEMAVRLQRQEERLGPSPYTQRAGLVDRRGLAGAGAVQRDGEVGGDGDPPLPAGGRPRLSGDAPPSRRVFSGKVQRWRHPLGEQPLFERATFSPSWYGFEKFPENL